MCLCIGHLLSAQNPAETVAARIAQKMKDTLELTDSLRIRVYQINLQLSQQKAALRNQFTRNDSLRTRMQQVENTRDALYQAILPAEKYVLYRQKKRNLISNN